MKDKNILNLLAAILTSATAPDTSPKTELKLKENRTSELVENLRRQLMKDNYDYVLDEATESTTSSATNPYHTGDGLITADGTTPLEENNGPFKQSNIINSDSTMNYTTFKSGNVKRRSHLHNKRSKYLSDSDIDGKTNETHYHYNKSQRDENKTKSRKTRRVGAVRKVKYNMLKVKGPARRSASAAHLLKEEKENEVSIVNLGEGPVPQFRLPEAHRQYMQDEPDSDLSYASDATSAPVSQAAVDLDR